NVLRSRLQGERAGDDPWDAPSLEWAAASPPASYNFVHLPIVTNRLPLWSAKEDRGFVVGMRNDRREVLVTTMLDAEPHRRYVLPGNSIWPFLAVLGFGIGLVGAVFQFGWYYVASV